MDDTRAADGGAGPPLAPLGRGAAVEYAAWFRALAEPTRVQIVSLLAHHGEPMTVGQITRAVHVGQATVSQHLKVLAEVRFVLAERRGTAHFYRLNEGCVDAFPTAADLVVGQYPPAPAGAGQPGGGSLASPPPREGGRDSVVIRAMEPADAGQVLAIYQAGLDTGQASFETTAPSWEVFDRGRLARHRYVAVAASTGAIAGWAAASAVSGRCVYADVVEHSVYVDPASHRRGAGSALLQALIGSTEAAGIWTIQSGIFPENSASLRLHERAGFRVVGIRKRIGRHHGRWRDVVLMERRSPIAGQD
jgi:L-amino acid N-acyltransferase YncA/DNA-binding transcriptional ArsR family regulator